MPKGRKPTPEELARALRENLRRRKAQQRARQQGVGDAAGRSDDGRMGDHSPSADDRPGAGTAPERADPGDGD